MEPHITFRAIGAVRSPVTDFEFTDWAEQVSHIVIDEALVPGLRGLGEYSHIVVVFYLDRVRFDPATELVRHPRDRAD